MAFVFTVGFFVPFLFTVGFFVPFLFTVGFFVPFLFTVGFFVPFLFTVGFLLALLLLFVAVGCPVMAALAGGTIVAARCIVLFLVFLFVFVFVFVFGCGMNMLPSVSRTKVLTDISSINILASNITIDGSNPLFLCQ